MRTSTATKVSLFISELEMRSITCEFVEYLKHVNGFGNNKIDSFLEDIIKLLPSHLINSAETFRLKISPDLKNPASLDYKRYRVKIFTDNLELKRYFRELGKFEVFVNQF